MKESLTCQAVTFEESAMERIESTLVPSRRAEYAILHSGEDVVFINNQKDMLGRNVAAVADETPK